VRSLGVVEIEVALRPVGQGRRGGIFAQVDVLVLDREPEAVDKKTVHQPTESIHADANASVQQAGGECIFCELSAPWWVLKIAGLVSASASMESFFAALNDERIHHCIYQTREEARTVRFFYIEARCNPRRLHPSLGYLSPKAFEQGNLPLPCVHENGGGPLIVLSPLTASRAILYLN